MKILYNSQLKHRLGSKFHSKNPSNPQHKEHADVERTQLIGKKVRYNLQLF